MQNLARKFEGAGEHLLGGRDFAVTDPNSIDAIGGESTLYPCLHPAHFLDVAKISHDPVPYVCVSLQIGNIQAVIEVRG
jgi:hypothetical protein